MRVFLDASALVPMALERDQWFVPVRRHLKALQQFGAPELFTTNWTYYEALAICRRAGIQAVGKLRRVVESQVSTSPVDPGSEAEAVRRFFGWSDKTASVVDHANLLTALRLGCAAILTFDDDFLPIASGTGIRILN